MAKKAATKKKAAPRKAAGAKASAPKKAAGKGAARSASAGAAPKAKPAKKAAKKKSSAKKATKVTAKKTAAKAAPKKKPASKKAAAKASSKKATTKKAATKKPAAKKAPEKKVAAKKPEPAKKASTKKATNASAKAASTEKAADKAPAKAGAAAKDDAGKSNRKGITIVEKKKVTRRPSAPKGRPSMPALTGSILGMGLGSGRPLIPSSDKPAAVGAASEEGDGKKPKSPFTKRQLDKYREVLISKRRDLLGDIDSMENEALKSDGGASSSLPQHMADQGSDSYDQTLSLDLAAADRILLREIDAALDRIAAKTYGVCERTGKPISKDRLDELPWARFSIEAAREMERRGR